MNIDIRNLQKWLNEEQEEPIDRQALARVLAVVEQSAQQEPVAWLHSANSTCVTTDPTAYARGLPLYTSPPASKPWVGLTEEDRLDIWKKSSSIDGAINATASKLQEKNA